MSASGPKADIETALCEDHSGLRLANFTTFPNFAVSAAMKAPNSDGAPGNAVPPSSIKRVLILGSARLAFKFNDRRWCFRRCADADPLARLETRHDRAH